jgi:hypothetical protein
LPLNKNFMYVNFNKVVSLDHEDNRGAFTLYSLPNEKSGLDCVLILHKTFCAQSNPDFSATRCKCTTMFPQIQRLYGLKIPLQTYIFKTIRK